MSDLLNKTYKRSMGYEFNYIELSRRDYSILVDYDLLKYETDYNCENDRFRVIVLNYPPEYYAAPLYITTNLLVKCFRNSDHSLSDFLNALQDEIII